MPRGFVQWGTEALGLNSEEIRLQLRNGIPRIDVLVRDREIIVSPLTLQPGEEQLVAERLRDLLIHRLVPGVAGWGLGVLAGSCKPFRGLKGRFGCV